ncbi:MAG: ParB/RepB/Spo0J family partition protein [Acidobacteriota bacterium]
MDIELHQLDLRYEKLRTVKPAAERRLLASLVEIGQQVPVVVVAGEEPGRFVLVDGYKRVRALQRLPSDTVKATCWDLSEAEALLLDRLMRTGEAASALEQGWLLQELLLRFDVTLEELGRRFGRCASWVSRRLSLVRELPEEIQERVRRGEVPAHAAMKHLVPLARANKDDCVRLVEGIAGKGLSSRQVGTLYTAWRDGLPETRERVIEAPLLLLRAREELTPSRTNDEGRLLVADFDILASVARRSLRRLRDGAIGRLLPPERKEIVRWFRAAKNEVERLNSVMAKEQRNAGPGDTASDPGAQAAGT